MEDRVTIFFKKSKNVSVFNSYTGSWMSRGIRLLPFFPLPDPIFLLYGADRGGFRRVSCGAGLGL